MDEDFDDLEDDFDDEMEEAQEVEEQNAAEQAAEERIIKNQLKAFTMKVISKKLTRATAFSDVKLLQQAKKMGKFNKELGLINRLFEANMAAKTSKYMSASPAIIWVIVGALCLFLLIAFVSIFAGVSADNQAGNSTAGVTGEDFYGVRVAYANEELAKTKIIEDYVDIVLKGAENIEETTSITTGGTTYDVQLTLNADLPASYDYSSFREVDFASDYDIVYSIVFNIAKKIYFLDNNEEYIGTSLIECVSGIKYFGYANIDALAQLTAQALVGSTTIDEVRDNNGAVSDAGVLNNISIQLEENVAYNLALEISAHNVRCEKLFVKDIILTGDEMVSGLTKENYSLYMFMPNKEVVFEAISFNVGSVNLENFAISATYAGNSYAITTDNMNLGDETDLCYIYSNEDINLRVPTFTDIDANNLEALATAQTLFDIVQNTELDNDLYLQTKEIEGEQIISLKISGLAVETSNSNPFILTEFETLWS